MVKIEKTRNKRIKNVIVCAMTAMLSVSSLSLSGCNSEQQLKSKDASVESSSISASSADKDSDSDKDQNEKEVETKKESNEEVSTASAVESSEGTSEEQESSTPQSGGEETSAASVEIVTEELAQEPVQETVEEPAETYYEPGDISGRLYIPDLGINVGLYTVSAYAALGVAQSVCDAEDSAVYIYDFPGRALIGDHCHQDFSTLYGAYVGMPVYIYGQEYVCVDTGWGVNNGESILVGNTDVVDINDGLTTLYTCASTSDSYDIWCVTVAPV